MDVTDWDSNVTEKTQMLLKKLKCYFLAQHQGGEGRGNLGVFSVHMSFYKLLMSYSI